MKIVHAQTILSESMLNELKEKSGEKYSKDAIAKAVEHFLSCQNGDAVYQKSLEEKLEETLRKRGKSKTPFSLGE